ncbi:putative integral membrane protein [Actinacidiphila reveromycinica]|uniref:Putative integral membrane protein n=1 Tax=Actinacidiphila reveromycinica TaxID=659352 RepID=A0A7U3VLY8_9ACTN|nr:vitamin K epoxide reductase family protein [Streptomyces sp. SN-593]BBA96012.1 putative integral membrane protein [Streptomyces sp. SN-593]
MTTSALDETRTDDDHAPQGPSGIVPSKAFTWLLLVSGALGLLASFVITNDKFVLLQNTVDGKPTHFSCSINPVIACGNVMESKQAHAFGFQNPIIGLVAYGVVICVAMGVFAGGRYKAWFWYGLQAGGLFGVCFISWLQYQTIYNIHAVCLWCCLAWVVTILIFWYTAVHNIRNGLIKVPGAVRSAVLEFHWVVPVLWYAIIGLLILTHFWYYWKTVI